MYLDNQQLKTKIEKLEALIETLKQMHGEDRKRIEVLEEFKKKVEEVGE